MSIRSDEHGCVGLCCSRDDECFCGMVSIKVKWLICVDKKKLIFSSSDQSLFAFSF
jgi:hypothetical protein